MSLIELYLGLVVAVGILMVIDLNMKNGISQ